MKTIEFDIGQSTKELFFPKERVKTKVQVLEILMEATRYMLIRPNVPTEKLAGKLILHVHKMSRLFFFNNNKYYSIAFPFFVSEYSERLCFSFRNDIEVDSQLISNVISIIKCESFNDKCSLGFAEPIYDIDNEYDGNFWMFLRELLLAEDGYIRYDKDEKGFLDAKEKGEEHRHPLNHYDVFYSNNASFKLGLDNEIVQNEFVDLLDIKTDCKYIKNLR